MDQGDFELGGLCPFTATDVVFITRNRQSVTVYQSVYKNGCCCIVVNLMVVSSNHGSLVTCTFFYLLNSLLCHSAFNNVSVNALHRVSRFYNLCQGMGKGGHKTIIRSQRSTNAACQEPTNTLGHPHLPSMCLACIACLAVFTACDCGVVTCGNGIVQDFRVLDWSTALHHILVRHWQKAPKCYLRVNIINA